MSKLQTLESQDHVTSSYIKFSAAEYRLKAFPSSKDLRVLPKVKIQPAKQN